MERNSSEKILRQQSCGKKFQAQISIYQIEYTVYQISSEKNFHAMSGQNRGEKNLLAENSGGKTLLAKNCGEKNF